MAGGAYAQLASQNEELEQKIALYNFSILLPLPHNAISDAVGLGDLGCDQDFLDLDLFYKLPDLFQTPMSEEKTYESYRLVSLRLDPEEGEYRMVFQPFLKATQPRGEMNVMAEDAALHLFFKASNVHVMKELRELQKKHSALPLNLLGVHPGFSSALMARKELNSLLCRVSGLELYKATFMTVRRGRVLWHFGGYHVENVNGQRVLGKAVEIPNLEEVFEDPSDTRTSVQRIVRGARRLRANVFPLPTQGEHLNEVYELADEVFHESHSNRIRRQIDRIENPLLNSPKTIDCISCHATESVRRQGEIQHLIKATKEAYPLPPTYSLDRSIPLQRLMDTINFRAFGYYDFEPVVMNRVLLESVYLQGKYMLKKID